MRLWRLPLLTLLGCCALACADEKARHAIDASVELDAALEPPDVPDVYLPDAADADDPYDFEPADSPGPIDASNPNEPPPDAAVLPDRPPRPPSCLVLAPGDDIEIDGELLSEPTWLRIEPDACPASRVTTREVAFTTHVICAGDAAVHVEIAMLGADLLELSTAAVSDPVLVVYANADRIENDPFACLAANDDAMFGGGVSNSARIESLSLEPGQRVIVVATSYERPQEHGVGSYRLTLHAE